MENLPATTDRKPVRFFGIKYRSLMRFSIVGFINTGVDFLLFLFLMRAIGVNYLVAQTISYAFGVVNSFIMNKTWTFDNARPDVAMPTQFLQFLALNILSLSVSLIGLKVLNGHLGMNIYEAKIMITVITWSIRYIGYKYWVFVSSLPMQVCKTSKGKAF